MALRSFNDIIDEQFPPGTQQRREFDRMRRRSAQKIRLVGWVYQSLFWIPPKRPTGYDEQFDVGTNWVGVGPVVAQFWADIASGVLDMLDQQDGGDSSAGDILYNALDGLSWRFFGDEVVPTWGSVKRGRAGKQRLVWRLRRRMMIERAEAIAEDLGL